MRLVFFSSEFPPGPGGIGTHAFHMSNALHEMGCRVTVISPQDYASQAEVAAFNNSVGFPILTLPSRRGALIEAVHRFRFLLRQLRQMDPDVVVASGERAVWLTALVCRLTSRQWIAVGHGTEYGQVSGWRSGLTRLSLDRADLVVSVSNYTRDLIHRLGAKPRCEIVIPNGADPGTFRRLPEEQIDEFRNRVGMRNCKIILTVGHVTERKGQEVIIRGLPQVLKAIPNSHYIMAGLPSEQDSLLDLAKELGVLDRIHFQGRVSRKELVLYVNVCDVFAMTSRMTSTGDCEGYGIAVVEAAMCGKPSVVSGESGLAEAVVDGETGIVVPPNDVTATADALIRLLSDDLLRTEMGAKAFKRGVTEQTWEQRGYQFNAAIRRVVKNQESVDHQLEQPVAIR